MSFEAPLNTTSEGFFQTPPRPGANAYLDDNLLQSIFMRHVAPHVPAAATSNIQDQLARLGKLACNELYEAHLAELSTYPRLIQYDPWGRRVDHIEVTPLWKRAAVIAAEEGLVALGYDPSLGRARRTVQHMLNYVVGPSLDFYGCPLAMTDGCTATILSLSGTPTGATVADRAVPHLLARDPGAFWTSGQWMTERTGGSDVGQTTTVAIPGASPTTMLLYGVKWFTSATTAQCALTLARPVKPSAAANGGTAWTGNPGGRGLGLFYVETRNPDAPSAHPARHGAFVNGLPLASPVVPERTTVATGADTVPLNGISINRLKEKFGTKKVPTAELTLHGAVATPLTTTDGTKRISPMLVVTRCWNTVAAASFSRRGFCLAKDYSTKRVAFADATHSKGAHVATLAALEAATILMTLACFRLTDLLGVCGEDLDGTVTSVGGVTMGKAGITVVHLDRTAEWIHAAHLVRILTPLMKLVTGKQAVAVASETLECFGGAGYVEDTGIPQLLGDAQVLPIWEGTTNVLALDVLRAIEHDSGRGLDLLIADLTSQLGAATKDLSDCVAGVRAAVEKAISWLKTHLAAKTTKGEARRDAQFTLEAGLRLFCLTIGKAYQISLAVQHAAWCSANGFESVAAAIRAACVFGAAEIPSWIVVPDEALRKLSRL